MDQQFILFIEQLDKSPPLISQGYLSKIRGCILVNFKFSPKVAISYVRSFPQYFHTAKSSPPDRQRWTELQNRTFLLLVLVKMQIGPIYLMGGLYLYGHCKRLACIQICFYATEISRCYRLAIA
jgi:hypothetical protein